jgi:hypothetical protein
MNKINLTLTEILSFNWLLTISWETLFLTFILFPPSIFIWYYKAARLAEKRLKKKPNFIFIIACLVYFCGFIFVILSNSEEYFIYEFFLIYFSAIYCYFYLTKVTMEAQDGSEKIASIGEKVGRFILLSLIFIGPLILQSNIKEMLFRDVTE